MENRTSVANIKIFESDNVFCMINNQLQECKLLKTHFFADGEGLYRAISIVKLPSGTIDQERVAYDTVFDSPADYESNKYAETKGFDLHSFIMPRVLMAKDIIGKARKIKSTYYTFENGEPTQHELKLETFYYDYVNNEWKSDELPDTQIYATRDDALSYNVTEVLDENALFSTRIGINKLIQLDDDQKELVHQLEELVVKLKEQGVLLLADTSDNYMVYNMRHIIAHNMNCDTEADIADDEERAKYEVADRWGKAFKVNINLEQWSEDYGIFFKRK